MEIANVEQAAAWDGHEGDVWTEHAERYDRAGHRQWPHLLEAAAVGATSSVLDVGCGTGRAACDIARIAVDGSVLGVDLSSKMLDLARRRAAAEGLANVRFVRGDAQVHPFGDGAHDRVVSNFGAMFFGDPLGAFTNIGRSMRADGRLALAAWRDLAENRWLVKLREALAVGRDLPTPPPGAPTPFALADPARVGPIFEAAGFADIDFAPLDEPIDLGRDPEDAYAFVRTMGIVEGLTQGLDDERRKLALSQVRGLLEASSGNDGVLLGSAAWIITASRR